MTPTLLSLHESHKARQARIAASAAQVKPRPPKPPEYFGASLSKHWFAQQERYMEAQEQPEQIKTIPEQPSIVEPVKEQSPRPKRLNSFAIIDHVAACYDVQPKSLIGRSRMARIVRPRHVAMYFIRKMLKLSLPQIGKILGGRNHTTVLHGVEKIKRLTLTDDGLASQLSIMESDLKGAL